MAIWLCSACAASTRQRRSRRLRPAPRRFRRRTIRFPVQACRECRRRPLSGHGCCCNDPSTTMKSGLSFLVAALRCEIDELEQLARTSELVGDDRPPGPCAAARTRHLERAAGLARASASPRSATSRSPNACGWSRPRALASSSSSRDRAHRQRRAAVQPHRLGAARAGRAARRCAGASARWSSTRRESTAAFVKLIAGLLAVVFEAADGATDPEISRAAGGAVQFHAGQGVRRPGARLRRRRLRLGPQRRRAPAAVAAPDRLAGALLPGVHRVLRRRRWPTSGARARRRRRLAELERLRRIACAAPAGVALDTELSQTWFDCCTRRIDAMQAVEERLAADLRALCEHKTAQARAELQAHEALLRQHAGQTATARRRSSTSAAPQPPAGSARPTAGSSSARSSTWCRSSRAACRR